MSDISDLHPTNPSSNLNTHTLFTEQIKIFLK